jgi:hypothetical protein
MGCFVYHPVTVTSNYTVDNFISIIRETKLTFLFIYRKNQFRIILGIKSRGKKEVLGIQVLFMWVGRNNVTVFQYAKRGSPTKKRLGNTAIAYSMK